MSFTILPERFTPQILRTESVWVPTIVRRLTILASTALAELRGQSLERSPHQCGEDQHLVVLNQGSFSEYYVDGEYLTPRTSSAGSQQEKRISHRPTKKPRCSQHVWGITLSGGEMKVIVF